MQPEPSPTAPRPRLNPFAFPSDTDFRFVLLIVTVIGVSMFYYRTLIPKIPGVGPRLANAQEMCIEEVFGTSSENMVDENFILKPEVADNLDTALADRYLECTFPIQMERAAWVVGGVLLLLATATALYWIFPIWKIRRDHLSSLSAEDAPEVVAYLAELCQEVKLSQTPTFLWNPLSPSNSGLAFGRLGRYYVALGGGLVTRFYTDRPAFRAILLHELAHLKNADVDKTYFAVAVWQSFLLVNILPFIITVLLNFTLPFNEILTIGALGLLVYLIRNSILRARELYADARASIWDGPLGALPQVLEALPEPRGRGWPAALQVHPSPSERRQMLENTDGLFTMSFWIAVATGINMFIVMINIRLWLDMFVLPLVWEAAILGILLAPLAAGIVGLGAWRAGFLRAARGNASAGARLLALGVGLGWMIGKPLLLGAFTFIDMSGKPESLFFLILSALFDFVWSGLLVAVMFSLFTWIAAAADSWTEVAVSHPRRRTYILALIFASGIFAAGLIWLLIPYRMYDLASGGNLQLMLVAFLLAFLSMQVSLLNPLAFVALSSLWALPLAAWFWRNRAESIANWAFIDPRLETLSPTAALSTLQPKISIRMGLITGLLFGGIVFIIFAILKVVGFYDVISNSEQYKAVLIFVLIALAVLMQLGVSTIAAGRIRRLGWVHGLFAAFVAGCVMTVGFLGINLLFRLLAGKAAAVAWGGGLEPIFVWTIFSLIVTQGTLLSLLPAIAISALFGRRRPFRQAKLMRVG